MTPMTPSEEMEREQTLIILARELCKGCANKDKPWNDPDCIGCNPENPRRVEIRHSRKTALVGLILLAAVVTLAACLIWAVLSNPPIPTGERPHFDDIVLRHDTGYAYTSTDDEGTIFVDRAGLVTTGVTVWGFGSDGTAYIAKDDGSCTWIGGAK